MIITIKNVLNATIIKQVQSLLKEAHFVDGKLSAGKVAATVKNNQELSLQSPLHKQLNRLVMAELVKHSQYQAAVLPAKVANAFYSRYSEGMAYGLHVDDFFSILLKNIQEANCIFIILVAATIVSN